MTDLSPTDLSTMTPRFRSATTPVWAVCASDGQRLYVVTQGDGQLYTIRTDTEHGASGISTAGRWARRELRALRQQSEPAVRDQSECRQQSSFSMRPPIRQRLLATLTGASALPPPAGHAAYGPACCSHARLGGGVAGWQPLLRGQLCDGHGSACPDPNVDRGRMHYSAGHRLRCRQLSPSSLRCFLCCSPSTATGNRVQRLCSGAGLRSARR